MRQLERLLIVSHVTHYAHGGKLYAHAPYAREINIWADLFPAVMIAAPYRESLPPGDAEAFTRPNIRVLPQYETGGTTLSAKLKQCALLPALVWGLCRAMRQADAIHVRCPGNLGLLGALLAPLFTRYRVAKYAGEWLGFPGEAWSFRLQRKLLGSRWWEAPVTVYGEWANQPPHVVPFFTSVMTQEQMARAQTAAAQKLASAPPAQGLKLLYVGRLTPSKNVDVLLAALALARSDTLPVQCKIVGAGPARAALEQQAAQLGLGDCLSFAGGVSFEQVLDFYEWADALVLVSNAEGWGKVLVEAMAYGLVCIGSTRGVIPYLLGEGRGRVVPPRNATALAAEIRQLAASPAAYLPLRARAAEWAQQLTLEGLREALRALLSAQWEVELDSQHVREWQEKTV